MQILSLLLLAGTALSAAIIPRDDSLQKRCLAIDSTAVSTIEYEFAQLIGNFSNATAEKFLADDFKGDSSDSINILIGKPLGSLTFTTKQNFIDEQQQVPLIPLNILQTNAVTCDTIVIRWILEFPEPALPVQGLSVLILEFNNGCWQLLEVYTEFNSLTYFENAFGYCTSTFTGPPSKRDYPYGKLSQ
jgi:hypothetical protein